MTINKATPIILVHKGNSSYLSHSLLHNKKVHPNTEIILLGDKRNAHFNSIVNHFYMKDYYVKASEIEKNYSHYSKNGYEFELFCIQRWAIIEEFMISKGYSSAIFIDSDVLCYQDLNNFKERFKDYGMTMVGISPHTNFINNIIILKEFNHFILDKYKSKDMEFFRRKEKQGAGVSDMSFFVEFRETFPSKLMNLTDIQDGIFDISFDYYGPFEGDKGVKKVYFKNNLPFFKYNQSNNLIPAYTIHFQGKSKKYLAKNAKVNSMIMLLYFKTIYFLQKIHEKIS